MAKGPCTRVEADEILARNRPSGVYRFAARAYTGYLYIYRKWTGYAWAVGVESYDKGINLEEARRAILKTTQVD